MHFFNCNPWWHCSYSSYCGSSVGSCNLLRITSSKILVHDAALIYTLTIEEYQNYWQMKWIRFNAKFCCEVSGFMWMFLQHINILVQAHSFNHNTLPHGSGLLKKEQHSPTLLVNEGKKKKTTQGVDLVFTISRSRYHEGSRWHSHGWQDPRFPSKTFPKASHCFWCVAFLPWWIPVHPR